MARSKMNRSRRTMAQKLKIAKMNEARLSRDTGSIPSSESGQPPELPATPTSPPGQPDTPLSASRRKLSYQKPGTQDVPSESCGPLPVTCINLNVLQTLFFSLKCLFCSSPSLHLQEGNGSRAFAVHLKLVCTACGEVNNELLPHSNKEHSNINRSVVAAGMSIGLKHAGIQRLAEGLGMPGIHHKTYMVYADQIFSSAQSVEQQILRDSRAIVRESYEKQDPSAFSEDGVLNIAVSFDGSWPKRGHTSKLGFGAVIDTLTGLVVDFQVLSTYCQTCASVGQRVMAARGEKAHEDWLQDHKGSGKCLKNYAGSSGGMECAAALTLWGKSTEHSMRYVTLVGDGDTKTFNALKQAEPYGADYVVVKEECVNHVAKRLNTGLRNLKATLAKRSIRIGGNAKGSLTDAKIGLLQSYYTKAVRTYNGSVAEMSAAIWAGFHHSTNVHDNCPPGLDSWCWHQRETARGIPDPDIRERKQTTYLNEDVAQHVKGVYERLTDTSLLSRCLLGKTQNANESLHSLIWLRCPKHLWSGYKQVFVACLLGVGEYNMGSRATRTFLQEVGCAINRTSLLLGDRRDRKRIKRADEAQDLVVKRRREKRKAAQQKERQEAEAAEGGPSYIPGGF